MTQENQENSQPQGQQQEQQQPGKKKSLVKRLVKYLVVLIIICIVLAGLLLVFINPIIKTSVCKIGPHFTGTPINIESVDLSIFNGSLALSNFSVGNPEGFQKPNIFELGSLDVKIDTASLFSDKIIVERVEIHNFNIDYELTVNGSNLDKIREHLEQVIAKGQEETEEDTSVEETPAASKQVVIRKLIIDNGTLFLSNKTLGTEIPIPLVPIEMDNLGENSDSFATTLNDFFTELMLSITSLVQGVDLQKIGQDFSDAANSLGNTLNESANDIGNAVMEGTSKLTEGIGSLFSSDSDKQ